MDGQAPHDGTLHDQVLHALPDSGKSPLKLDPIPFGQPEVQQHLLVLLNEGGLEDQLASSPINTADKSQCLE